VGSALNKFKDDRQIYHIWGYHCWGILWTHWQAAEDKKKDVKQKFEARVKKEQAEKKQKEQAEKKQQEQAEPSLQAVKEEIEQEQAASEDTLSLPVQEQWAAIAADPLSLPVQGQVRHFQSQAESSGGIIRHDICVGSICIETRVCLPSLSQPLFPTQKQKS
jgi:O6-methylguanine-DNA--protein-cysteine methyltransferase